MKKLSNNKLKRESQRRSLWVLLTAFFFSFAVTCKVSAQQTSNFHYYSIPVSTDTVNLDSFSIIPNTLVVRSGNGDLIDSNDYSLLAFQSKLIWNRKPGVDSVKVFYRTYPFALGRTSYHKDYNAYKASSENAFINPFIYNPGTVQEPWIDFGNLDYNGSYSRSLSFGNNQDVVLNSLFNLQLSGMLTRDVEITAAITDNNVPIQPEGNTQQIQEFDKIFIQIRKDKHKVIVGDFDLFNPDITHFMKFSKKYQGGYYSGEYDVKKAGVFRTGVAGGISRGKFARNYLTVSEGNQGPYKLTGSNGETYIVILANSEEVFVNGVKMERGADKDYVIDYNLGEVTFMPRKIITKDLRVYVEFEYSDRNYLRSTAFVNTEFSHKKADVYFNLFSEQDSKGQNIQQTLDAEKKLFLSTVGDSIQNAFYHGWDSVAYDPNRVLYRLVADSLGFDSVFVYSTDTNLAKFSVSFSYVGEGKGDYIPAASTANGRVYQWVAPYVDSVGLQHQGSYLPVILLITPKYQQLYSLGTIARIDAKNQFKAEVAMSNTDLNMFSTLDNKDNLGFAARAAYTGGVVVKTDSTLKALQHFDVDISYEFLQDRFNTVERYRNIEFNRDWNLQTQPVRYNEHLGVANLSYVWTKTGNISYRFKTYIQDSVYHGYENALSGSFSHNGFNIQFTNSYLKTKSTISKSDFMRPKADFYYSSTKTKGWKIGALYDHEVNMIRPAASDTLASNSYLWQNYKVYAYTADSSVNRFGIELVMRYEHRPDGKSFALPFFRAQTVNFTGQVNSLKNQTLNYSLTYRHVKDSDSTNSDQPEHFYLGRIDYNLTILKGFIRSSTLYEIGSGRQQKTQLVYQKSPTNQGDFVWIGDLNENGVQDINEFGVKTGSDSATYTRVFIVTPEYVSVNTNQFNQVLNINPAAIWKTKTGIRKVLAMFSIFASVSVTKKTFAEKNKKVGDYFNPIPLKRENSQLVATSISSRNTLYFNRLDPKYGIQFDFNYARNKTLLTTGFENRYLQSQGATVRWNIVKSLNIQSAYTNGVKANESDFYDDLKYKFTYNDVVTELSYQLKTTFRLGLKYDLSLKVNPTDSVGKQSSNVHKVTLSGKYNRQSKSTVDGSLSYATIVYNDKGLANQQLEFAMLEGLRAGNNLVWNLSYSQNLTPFIQLTLTYDGRMTGFSKGDKTSLKPIHTGRAEIRAIF